MSSLNLFSISAGINKEKKTAFFTVVGNGSVPYSHNGHLPFLSLIIPSLCGSGRGFAKYRQVPSKVAGGANVNDS
jgi:hypothetical protein